MGKNKIKTKEKLTGGWESLHAVIWMLGLAVIAWQGWWWPGILVLVAISILFEAFVKQIAPDSVITVTKGDQSDLFPEPPAPFNMSGSAEPAAKAGLYHRADLLPVNCPRCGGPVRGQDIHWTGSQSADCPFCGSNLPMRSL